MERSATSSRDWMKPMPELLEDVMAPDVASSATQFAALSRSNPFPGLRPYMEEDSSWFFGRSAETNDLLKRLRRLHFVAIVGASGSGKSSLVRSGVLPQVRDGYLDAEWYMATFRPGDRPLANLRDALEAVLPGIPTGALDEAFESGPKGLVRAIGASGLPPNGRVLILVDQFEELFQFAQRSGEEAQEEVKQFLKLLLAAVVSDDVPVYVLMTMRLEWLNECATYTGLAEAMNEGLYLVPPMERRQFQQAILGPLEMADGSITGSLTDRMLNDLNNRTDQLPVLQHALSRLWKRCGTAQTFAGGDYEAVGTVSNCLSQHAEAVYGELTESQQKLAEQIFRAITQVSQNRKMRRPRPVSEIMTLTGASFTDVAAVVTTFSRSGRSFLVTTQGALTEHSIVDLSHEALIRQWKRLSDWVDSEAELQSRLHRLDEDAADWDRNRKANRSCLYRGAQLQRAERLLPSLKAESASAAFVRASAQARFWRKVQTQGIAALVAIAVLAFVAYQVRERAERQKQSLALAREQQRNAQIEADNAKLQAAKAQEFQQNLVQQIDAAHGSATALAAIAKNISAPRIYVQFAAGQANLARAVQARLEAKGYVVPGTEAIASGNVPQQSQIRFFHDTDRATATQIAGVLRSSVPGDVSAQSFPNPRQIVPAGQFELWIVPPSAVARESAPAAASSAPATVAAAPKPAAPEPAPVVVPPTLNASLSSDHTTPGAGVTLTWQADNAQVTINNGIGNVAPSGSLTVAPSQSTKYEIVAKNAGGNVSKTLALTVAEPTPVLKVPSAATPVKSELSQVKGALSRYREAYESQSVDELRKAWPTMSGNQAKDLVRSFSQFNAVRLDINCPDDAFHIDGNTANATCQQVATYTVKGKKLPVSASNWHFRFGKDNGTWVVTEPRQEH